MADAANPATNAPSGRNPWLAGSIVAFTRPSCERGPLS
jgi:hypothetical protein